VGAQLGAMRLDQLPEGRLVTPRAAASSRCSYGDAPAGTVLTGR
jgi:hypothetical protein